MKIEESSKILVRVLNYISGEVPHPILIGTYASYYKYSATSLGVLMRDGDKLKIQTPDKDNVKALKRCLDGLKLEENHIALIDVENDQYICKFIENPKYKSWELIEYNWEVLIPRPDPNLSNLLSIVWGNKTKLFLSIRETFGTSLILFMNKLYRFSSKRDSPSILGLDTLQNIIFENSNLPLLTYDTLIRISELDLKYGDRTHLKEENTNKLLEIITEGFKKISQKKVSEGERTTKAVSIREFKGLANLDMLPKSGWKEYEDRWIIFFPENYPKPEIAFEQIIYTYGTLYIYMLKGQKKPKREEVLKKLDLIDTLTVNIQ